LYISEQKNNHDWEILWLTVTFGGNPAEPNGVPANVD